MASENAASVRGGNGGGLGGEGGGEGGLGGGGKGGGEGKGGKKFCTIFTHVSLDSVNVPFSSTSSPTSGRARGKYLPSPG